LRIKKVVYNYYSSRCIQNINCLVVFVALLNFHSSMLFRGGCSTNK
jgi:hypothetical protein